MEQNDVEAWLWICADEDLAGLAICWRVGLQGAEDVVVLVGHHDDFKGLQRSCSNNSRHAVTSLLQSSHTATSVGLQLSMPSMKMNLLGGRDLLPE